MRMPSWKKCIEKVTSKPAWLMTIGVSLSVLCTGITSYYAVKLGRGTPSGASGRSESDESSTDFGVSFWGQVVLILVGSIVGPVMAMFFAYLQDLARRRDMGQLDHRLTAEVERRVAEALGQRIDAAVEERFTEELDERLDAQIQERLTAELPERVRGHVEETLTAELDERLDAQIQQRLTAELPERVRGHVEETLTAELDQGLDAGTQGTLAAALDARVARAVKQQLATTLNQRLNASVAEIWDATLEERVATLDRQLADATGGEMYPQNEESPPVPPEEASDDALGEEVPKTLEERLLRIEYLLWRLLPRDS